MVPDASNTALALIAFAFAMVGAEYATIVTNAMLPGLAPRSAIGRVSGSGYALGYVGGVAALAVFLALFADDGSGRTILGAAPALGLDGAAREGTRFVGPFTALWFAVFMVPFILWVREPPTARRDASVVGAMGDVRAMLRAVPGRPSLLAWLAGSMLYRDALAALYAFGGTYAALVLNWETTSIGLFGILGAVTAAAASWAGGRLDARLGPKPVIMGCVLVLTGVVLVLCATSREMLLGVPLAPGSTAPDIALFVLGAVIGGAGGVLQAASRTMMVRHADPERATEAFGLYALSGKATAFLAPLAIGIATAATGSARLGIFPVAILFLAGLVLLRWVDPDGDRR
jgi:UMF1 family MFS transporter